MSREGRIAQYALALREAESFGGVHAVEEACRFLCQNDLFYLLAFAMGRKDVRENDWLYARCVEVGEHPDGYLDLWAREHYKSTVITFAKTIQDILCNPDVTVGIFSHTKPIARAFLRQIKYELETNEFLQRLFPDILYTDPKNQAPADGNGWSEDKGITVKRASNPKEATVEAHGLVDGQPTSKHFSLLVYDDVVTRESVTSPDMMKKTTEAMELSFNLGAEGGKRRFIGTRYHFNDTYKVVIDRKIAIPRIHAATDDGKVTGNPVFLSRESLEKKRQEQGPYVYSCQQLQNPNEEGSHGFKKEWLRYYSNRPNIADLNNYLLVDPANSKKKGSDYSVFWVIGLGMDNNYYLLDGVRDRLNLKERTDTVFRLHKKYKPLGVGYEQYGMQADIQHIEEKMETLNYRFTITALSGSTPKHDRIKRLQPKFEQGRVWLPATLPQTTQEGKVENLIELFISEEYEAFPVCIHDDMLDDMANILHPSLEAMFPSSNRKSIVQRFDCYTPLDSMVGY